MIAKSDAASIFRDTRGSRSIEISVPGAFTAVGFSGQQKNPGASAAERGRPSLFKTIDEDQRQRHVHINRLDRSTYPGRISVLTSGATPNIPIVSFMTPEVKVIAVHIDGERREFTCDHTGSLHFLLPALSQGDDPLFTPTLCSFTVNKVVRVSEVIPDTSDNRALGIAIQTVNLSPANSDIG